MSNLSPLFDQCGEPGDGQDRRFYRSCSQNGGEEEVSNTRGCHLMSQRGHVTCFDGLKRAVECLQHAPKCVGHHARVVDTTIHLCGKSNCLNLKDKTTSFSRRIGSSKNLKDLEDRPTQPTSFSYLCYSRGPYEYPPGAPYKLVRSSYRVSYELRTGILIRSNGSSKLTRTSSYEPVGRRPILSNIEYPFRIHFHRSSNTE